jgi:hypothetical protein
MVCLTYVYLCLEKVCGCINDLIRYSNVIFI